MIPIGVYILDPAKKEAYARERLKDELAQAEADAKDLNNPAWREGLRVELIRNSKIVYRDAGRHAKMCLDALRVLAVLELRCAEPADDSEGAA